MIKYSVLTFIFGNYECLHEVLDVQDDIEYICVTDNKNLKSKTWKIVYDQINTFYTSFRKVIEVRYNPFKYVHTDVCLIIDGSIELKQIPYKLLYNIDHNYDIATFLHPGRENLYDEMDAWKKLRNLDQIYINTCKCILKSLNINKTYKGLFQVNMLCFKKSDKLLNFLKYCYSIIISACKINDAFRVDQVIFSAVLKNNDNLKSIIISPLELGGKYFQQYAHNSNMHYGLKNINLNIPHYGNYFNKKNIAYFIDNLFLLNDYVTAAICNFNTTELTNNVIRDILKFSNIKKIIIFDNSNKIKFKLDNDLINNDISIFDNTKQTYVNFDKILNTYKLADNCKVNNYASLKHCLSIQFLLNICSSKYLLLCDSDIIIKKNLDFLNTIHKYLTIADIEYTNTASENMNMNLGKTRFTPFIQLFNIDMMNKMNISYFDSMRIHGIEYGNNYDTGASLYEDVINKNIPYKKIKNTNYIIHLGHKSWSKIK